VFRLGGEEFLVALPDVEPGTASEIAERLLQRVSSFDWRSLAPGLAVTLSVGLAETPQYDEDELVARADGALYRAKHLGRNCIAYG
jgi:diguanylate cyclase (GGDEF)-like protein